MGKNNFQKSGLKTTDKEYGNFAGCSINQKSADKNRMTACHGTPKGKGKARCSVWTPFWSDMRMNAYNEYCYETRGILR